MSEQDLFAVQWRKSSRSAQGGDDCVEVAALQGVVAVRDSKAPDGPVLTFGAPAFRAFLETLLVED